MIRRQHVVRDFFEQAEDMREALDARFKDAYAHSINWHYFCDPQKYAYLRALPQDVFPKEVFDRFMQRLRAWCMENLGLMPVDLPYLNMMVDGCRLGLHSDFHNGAFGYVFSLTRWENRNFSGGETLLLRDGIPSYKRHHVHGDVLYELVPAHFNQLLVFDDRIVHATPTIEGSMDPLHARIALVGHIRAISPVVSGSMPAAEVRKVMLQALPHVRARIANVKDVQGTITYRLVVGPSGGVESMTTLTDNLVTPVSGYDRSEAVGAVRAAVQQVIGGLKFAASTGTSVVTLPVLVPIPDLRPIEFSVEHATSREALREWLATELSEVDRIEFQGSWEGESFSVREPIAGRIEVEPNRITFSFDAPMWVPSQRERFKTTLMEWAQAASANAAREVFQA